MSYILEALKKSSEDRARLTGSGGQQVPVAAVSGHGSLSTSFSWRWVVGLGLAVLASAAAYFLLAPRASGPATARVEIAASPAPVAALALPEQTPPAPPAPRVPSTPPVPAMPAAQPLPSTPPVKRVQPAEAPSGDPLAVKTTRPPVASRVQAYVSELREALQPPSAPAEKAPVPAPVPAAPPPVAAHAPGPVPAAQASAEMPPELLRQVQGIPIAAHVYSSRPADRMVVIDGRAAREGDVTASGMAIEQITPTGIVVTYKGYRANRTVH